MPIESTAPDIKVTRPQIYFGEKTDRFVYVNTKQKEFDFPQGDTNAYRPYEGAGGFPIGNGPGACSSPGSWRFVGLPSPTT